jgi:hypothetical protein
MIRTRFLLCLLLGSFASCALAGPARAQEAQLFATTLTSSHPMLDASTGGGMLLSVDLTNWVAIGGMVSRVRGATTRDGTICVRIQPRLTGCQPGRVRDDVTISALRIGVYPAVELVSGLRAGIGAGVAISELHATSRGETAPLLGDLYVPPSAQLGGFARFELNYVPWPRVPLGIVLTGVGNWINFDGCRTESNYHDAFCGTERFGELQAGVSYRLRR